MSDADWYSNSSQWRQELQILGVFTDHEQLLRDPARCHLLMSLLVNKFMKLASPREQKFDYVVGHGSENEGLASSIAHLISKYRPIDDRNHRYYRAYTEYAHTPTLCGPITRYQSPLQKTCGFNRSSLPEEANTLLVTSVFTNTTSIKDSIAAITQVKAKCLPYLLTYMNLTSLEKTHGLQIISAVQAPSETKQMAG